MLLTYVHAKQDLYVVYASSFELPILPFDEISVFLTFYLCHFSSFFCSSEVVAPRLLRSPSLNSNCMKVVVLPYCINFPLFLTGMHPPSIHPYLGRS